MKWLIVLLALFSIVPVVGACGGDGQMSLEAYFTELDDLDNDRRQRTDEIAEQLQLPDDPPSTFDAALRDRYRDGNRDVLAALDEFIDGFKDVDPPEEVRDLHERSENALDDHRNAFDKFIDKLAEIDSFDDIDTLHADVNGPEQAQHDLCLELEAKAAENNIQVDLDC